MSRVCIEAQGQSQAALCCCKHISGLLLEHDCLDYTVALRKCWGLFPKCLLKGRLLSAEHHLQLRDHSVFS